MGTHEVNAETSDNGTPSEPAKASPTRWVAPVSLVIAVIAVVIAGWALVQSQAEPAGNATQSTADHARAPEDAKKRVCSAFELVRKAVAIQTNTNLGVDPVAQSAVAGNARLATLGGGEYLLTRLDPGTPTDLADAVRSFAETLQDIGMNQLADVSNTDPNLAAKLQGATAASDQIAKMCA
ncbi:hypothetical protein [Mycolicibacterium sp. XJ1819]